MVSSKYPFPRNISENEKVAFDLRKSIVSSKMVIAGNIRKRKVINVTKMLVYKNL